MNLGIGQILIILLLVVLLFGNFPKLLRDLGEGLKDFQKIMSQESKDGHSKKD